MKVYVDGTLVLTQTVATSTWATYWIRRTLKVEFTNDGMVGTEGPQPPRRRGVVYT